MPSIDSIVSVSISTNSTTVSREGFGTPLVLAYHTRFLERYRTYTTLAEMTADGFAVYDDAYRMAAAAFAQDPTVTQIVVGRLPAAPSYTSTLTMTSAVEGAVIKATVIEPTTGTAVPLTYTVPAAQTLTQVATAFELLVEGVTGVDSGSSVAVVTVTPTVAGRRVHIYDLQNITIEETTADAGYDTELTALQAENDDWYGITTDSSSPANVADVAAWTLTNKKLYFAATNSSGELAGTGTLGSALDALSNDRTVLIYAPNSHEFAGAAWAGAGLAQSPGTITWAFKSLAGVTAKNLTTTQRNFLTADNINTYETIASVPVTLPGVVTSGEFIDIRHGIDALEAAIKEDVFALLVNSSKVPMTRAGLDLIHSAILGAMKRFEGTENVPGLLAEGTSSVIMPLISAISTANRAARRVTGIRFSATLEGAIHSITVVGTLSV